MLYTMLLHNNALSFVGAVHEMSTFVARGVTITLVTGAVGTVTQIAMKTHAHIHQHMLNKCSVRSAYIDCCLINQFVVLCIRSYHTTPHMPAKQEILTKIRNLKPTNETFPTFSKHPTY
jgi:hypothetical protein